MNPAALSAYRLAAGQAPETPATTPAGLSFGEVLGRAVENVVDTTRAADATSVRAMTGEAGVTEVMLAVSKAELALQTTVALRDRVVSAYQDVMRMPI